MKHESRAKLESAISEVISNSEARERIRRETEVLVTASRMLNEIDRKRIEAGLTKADLARGAGMQPSNLRKILSQGSGRLELTTYLKLASALNLQVAVSQIETARDPL